MDLVRRISRVKEEQAEREEEAMRALHSSWAWTTPVDQLKLANLDKRLRDAVSSKKVRLLRSEWLLSRPPGWRLPRRQALEQLESQGESLPFLSPREACCWLECGQRQIAVLSHGWLSMPHPDPDGARVEAVKKMLSADRSIAGLFWDYASLPMKPREREEDDLFGAALAVMGDLFASAVGTMVVQIHEIPQRPLRFDGAVHISGLPVHENDDQEIRKQSIELMKACLSSFGTITEMRVAAQGGGSALVRYSGEASARSCVKMGAQALQAAGIASDGIIVGPYYNDKHAKTRGWMVFEEGMAQVALSKLDAFPRTAKALQSLERPKLARLAQDGTLTPLVGGNREKEDAALAAANATVAGRAVTAATKAAAANAPAPAPAKEHAKSSSAPAGSAPMGTFTFRDVKGAVVVQKVPLPPPPPAPLEPLSTLEQRIKAAHFTVPSDKAAVLERAREYAESLDALLEHAAEGLIPDTSMAYDGERNAVGTPHGFGTLITLGGNEVYNGEFKNGVKEGQGSQRYLDGSTYSGTWLNGMRHGEGSLTNATADERFVGNWHQDKKHGEGVEEIYCIIKIDVMQGANTNMSTQDVLEWKTVWSGEHVFDQKVSQRRDDFKNGEMEDAAATLSVALSNAAPASK